MHLTSLLAALAEVRVNPGESLRLAGDVRVAPPLGRHPATLRFKLERFERAWRTADEWAFPLGNTQVLPIAAEVASPVGGTYRVTVWIERHHAEAPRAIDLSALALRAVAPVA